ncbi:MAG: SRPBCC family protein [Gammaproteobacteria bacterium]|nr:SRPBCC family protein [Gammaproteobacteria bacterium]
MAKLSMQTRVNVEPKSLWDVVGKFNALPEWHPMIQASKLEDGGRIRRLSIVGGGEIVERLEQIDAEDRMYRYSIISGPMPVMNYTATLRIKDDPESKGSIVEWTGEFEPKSGSGESDVMQSMQSVYQAGLDNLRRMFGG